MLGNEDSGRGDQGTTEPLGTLCSVSGSKSVRLIPMISAHCWPYKKNWVGDGKCDDAVNVELCEYDGGDCCLNIIDALYCDDCICHFDSQKHPTLKPPFGKSSSGITVRVR